MAKRRYEEEDDNIEYGSGRYINTDGDLFDKHEYEEEEDHNIEDNVNIDDDDDDDDKKNSIIDEIEDTEEDADKTVKKKRGNLKPKLIGKHSLAYDTIYKGKKSVAPQEPMYQAEHFIKNAGGSLDIQDNDLNLEESKNSIDAFREIRLKDEIHKLLKNNTDINFTANRRKPAKTDFNAYYALLLKELVVFGYNRTEIFIELSGYFSDNIWNMFQLLEKQYSNIVIKELKDKYGLSDMEKINFLG